LLDIESTIINTPLLDKAVEGVVGDKGESGTCDVARGVVGANPRLNVGPIVGLIGAH